MKSFDIYKLPSSRPVGNPGMAPYVFNKREKKIETENKQIKRIPVKKRETIHLTPSENSPCLMKQVFKIVYFISIDKNQKNFSSILKTLRLKNGEKIWHLAWHELAP